MPVNVAAHGQWGGEVECVSAGGVGHAAGCGDESAAGVMPVTSSVLLVPMIIVQRVRL